MGHSFKRLVIKYQGEKANKFEYLVFDIQYYQTYIVYKYHINRDLTSTKIVSMNNISEINVYDMTDAEVDAWMKGFIK